jgi:excisionase family DNA binding protein
MARGQPFHEGQTELLTTAQTAELLNVHPNTVRNWADAALLPSYRIGPRRDRRFRRDDVESLLTASSEASAES